MDISRKNKVLIAAGIVVFALITGTIGALVGGAAVALWGKDTTPPPAGVYAPNPKIMDKLDALAEADEEIKDKLAALKEQGRDLDLKIENLRGDTMSQPRPKGVYETLPPAYVDKVDDFFRTANARALLNQSVSKDPSLIFGQPIFVSFDTITVPYKFSENYHYLLVKVTILNDLYELQFDVIWDSMEGQGR